MPLSAGAAVGAGSSSDGGGQLPSVNITPYAGSDGLDTLSTQSAGTLSSPNAALGSGLGCRGVMVLQLCDQGNLWQALSGGYLRHAPGAPNMPAVLLRLRDVARGMAYLHAQGIAHGDLKCARGAGGSAEHRAPAQRAGQACRCCSQMSHQRAHTQRPLLRTTAPPCAPAAGARTSCSRRTAPMRLAAARW